MKKFLTYLLIIVVAVAIIAGVYWLLTCPLKEESSGKVLPTLEEMQRKAAEAIASGNSYIAPYDPEMAVENGGIEMVVNQLLMTLNKDETEKVADELAKKVNGIVVGFIYPNTYQIELKTSTIDGLENAIGVIETDSRVQVVVENAIFEAK